MDRYLQIFSRWFPFLVTNIFKYIFTLILAFGKKNQIYFHIPIVGWSAWSEIMSSEVKELFLVFPEWRWWWLVPILGECHHQDNTLTPIIMDLLRTYSHTYYPGPNSINLHTLTYQPTYITRPVFYNIYLWSWRDSTLQLGRLREKSICALGRASPNGRKWKLLGESWKFRIWLKNFGGKKLIQRKRTIKVRSTRIDGQPYQNWHRTEQRIRKAITLVIPSAVNALQNKYIFSHQCWKNGFLVTNEKCIQESDVFALDFSCGANLCLIEWTCQVRFGSIQFLSSRVFIISDVFPNFRKREGEQISIILWISGKKIVASLFMNTWTKTV